MNKDIFLKIRKSVSEEKPLIHCITNPISINQCANAVLSIGARPIMAEHPEEVEEITKTAGGLLLNLGNITDVRMKSILKSAEIATKQNIPFIIDLVGVACSELRRNFAIKLLATTKPTAIKGNYSEICAIYLKNYKASGVDSAAMNTEDINKISVLLARKYNTSVLASGKTDIITDGKRLFHIANGTGELSSVTGTGCMLGVLSASYLSVSPDINALITACGVLGISGELSVTNKGIGTFFVNLLDNLSTLSKEDFNNKLRLEEIEIEES